MTWVMLAVVAGSLVVSQHDTRELCEGRAAMVREVTKGPAKCVQLMWTFGTITFGGGNLITVPNDGGGK